MLTQQGIDNLDTWEDWCDALQDVVERHGAATLSRIMTPDALLLLMRQERKARSERNKLAHEASRLSEENNKLRREQENYEGRQS